MPDAGCMIIDDSTEALLRMTELGQAVAGASTARIVEAVKSYAEKRRWTLVPYTLYREWVTNEVRDTDCHWVVLDPLLRLEELEGSCSSLRLTRGVPQSQPLAEADGAESGFDLLVGPVGIVDDVASSGRTIAHVARAIGRAGAHVAQVRLCGSSHSARDFLARSLTGTRWSAYIPGDWRVIHLRDGCPHLPHTGRPPSSSYIVTEDGSRVPLRVASTGVLGNLWQVLWLEPAIRSIIEESRREVVRLLGEELGKEARVSDLQLLGEAVPALVRANEEVGAETRLVDLL